MLAVYYLLLTYMVASIPTGAILSVLVADVDLRAHGSGNIGATNATRVVGRGVGALTLLGDALKGLIPVLLAPLVWSWGPYADAVALAAFVGHCWSAYLGFKGGKGVATAGGAMLALAPISTGITVAAWVAVVALTKRSSLGALTAVFLLPLLVSWFEPAHGPVTLLIALGVAWRHTDNIKRLLTGTER